jgi:hypothetical protein
MLPAARFYREHFITLLSIPPHASHMLHPLDKALFGPLKTACATKGDKFMVDNPRKSLSQIQVPGLFWSVYSRTATVEKAEHGFCSTRIHPLNPDFLFFLMKTSHRHW